MVGGPLRRWVCAEGVGYRGGLEIQEARRACERERERGREREKARSCAPARDSVGGSIGRSVGRSSGIDFRRSTGSTRNSIT